MIQVKRLRYANFRRVFGLYCRMKFILLITCFYVKIIFCFGFRSAIGRTVSAITLAVSKQDNSIWDQITNPSLSLGVGCTGLFVVLVNRLSIIDDVSDVQSRADILSVVAASALLLNALTEQDIEARERASVALVGYALPNIYVRSDIAEKESIGCKWLCDSLVKLSSIKSVHVLSKGKFIAAQGIIGSNRESSLDFSSNPGGTILRKALSLSVHLCCFLS